MIAGKRDLWDFRKAQPHPDGGARLPLSMLKDPTLKLALEFWREQSKEEIPSRAAIDPIKLGATLLPYVFLADVRNEEPRFRFRLAGSKIEDVFGSLKGRSLNDIDLDGETEDIANQYETAISERGPVYCMHNFVTDQNRRRHYHRLVMPLSTDGDHIDALFGAVVFNRGHSVTS